MEQRLSQLEQDVALLKQLFTLNLQKLSEQCSQLQIAMYGSPEVPGSGLALRVDRLEVQAGQRNWTLKAAWSALVALCSAMLGGYLSK